MVAWIYPKLLPRVFLRSTTHHRSNHEKVANTRVQHLHRSQSRGEGQPTGNGMNRNLVRVQRTWRFHCCLASPMHRLDLPLPPIDLGTTRSTIAGLHCCCCDFHRQLPRDQNAQTKDRTRPLGQTEYARPDNPTRLSTPYFVNLILRSRPFLLRQHLSRSAPPSLPSL